MTKTVDQFSALTSPADDDYVLIWDTSAGATKKIAYSYVSALDLASAINGATNLASPAADDYLLILDTSVGTAKKVAFSVVDATGAVATHAALTTTHGVTGDLVGTGGAQTLSGKTLASPTITTQAVVPLIYGDTAANGDITIHGTSNGTKTTSYVILQPSGGGVAIGQATAASTLDVAGSIRGNHDANTTSYFGRAAIGYDGATSDSATFAHLDHNSAASAGFRQASDGTPTINASTSRSIKLAVNGTNLYAVDASAIYPLTDDAYDLGLILNRYDDVYATNGTIQTSDVRLKDDVSASDLGLAFIRALEPLRYKFAGKTRPHYGLASQQVRRVLDELGIPDFAGYIHDRGADAYGLRYTEFIAPLITAIQEIADRLDRIEAA